MLCNNCNKQVKEGADFCNNCGAKLTGGNVTPAPQPDMKNTYEPPQPTHIVNAQNGAARFCPKCGNTLKAGAAFCNGCGRSIHANGVDPEPRFPTRNAAQVSGTIAVNTNNVLKNRKTIIIAAAALVLIIVGIFTAFAVQKNNAAAELAKIENALHSYERAMTELNFSYADTFCVTGGQVNQRFLGGLPSISIKGFEVSLSGVLQSAGILLNSTIELLSGAGYDYNMDFSQSDITITGDRASVKATISVPLFNYSKNSTISMRNIDGEWLIESIG